MIWVLLFVGVTVIGLGLIHGLLPPGYPALWGDDDEEDEK